jgi:putative inorganic carbon (HCO3(-)) transporter
MAHKAHVLDYEPVTPSRVAGGFDASLTDNSPESNWPKRESPVDSLPKRTKLAVQIDPQTQPLPVQAQTTFSQRGHVLSFVGLFLFTVIVYVRPYEVISSLSWLSKGAFWIALATVLVFIPTQLTLEGNLTARPREVNLVLLLCLFALLSIPLATNPADAWDEFSTSYIKVVLLFIVMVNVVRTRARLRSLLLLGLAIGSYVSVNAINDYRLDRLTERGERIAGSLGGMLQNPNDLALYLVTLVPIAVGLLLASQGPLKRIAYAVIAALMVVAIVFTFSRGGFIGLLAAFAVLGLKFGRKHRSQVIIVGVLCLVLFIALAPGNYGTRIASIFGNDPTGSSGARKALLIQSFIVSLRHPLLGVGMSNFHIYSEHEQVSHNSYTQVSAEMGLMAALIYVMFVVAPIRKLRRLESQTYEDRLRSKDYYLAVALQASLIGYMFASFFVSVAYLWHIYYLVGYAVCLRRLHEAGAGPPRTDTGAAGTGLLNPLTTIPTSTD